LTTSRYFTPLGEVIHGKGVMPDVIVEEGRIELASQPQPQQKPEDIFEEIDKVEKEEKTLDYKSDNQLMRAVDILKAIRIYKEIK
jgi:C-terminal processing protease CtpA/Prc